jgi:hypothetical protein
MEPVSKKVFALLQAMVEKLNEEHDRWCRNATPEEIEDTRTGEIISPRFELEAIEEEEIPDYEANVGLHDLDGEETEYGTPEYIALEIMNIRYLSGHHGNSYGI